MRDGTINCTMLLFTFALIIGFFHKSLLTVPRNCTKEEYCLPVPERACDKSLCLAFSLDEWVAMGQAGLKAYTWSLAQAPYISYCPLIFDLEKSTTYDNKRAANTIMTLNTGPYCNISTTTTQMFYPDEPDTYTGKNLMLTTEHAGDQYEVCLLYMDPGVSYVYRRCRIDPPPAYGQGCASFYVYEVVSGTCNRDKLMKFLQSLGIDFPQLFVSCL